MQSSRLLAVAVLALAILVSCSMLVPVASFAVTSNGGAGKRIPVVFHLEGTLISGTLTEGEIQITSGFVIVRGTKYAFDLSNTQTAVSNIVKTDPSWSVCGTPQSVLYSGGIGLTDNVVLGLAALYTITSPNVLGIQFGVGGCPYPGTTALTNPPTTFYVAIVADGTLSADGAHVTIMGHGLASQVSP